MYINNGTIVLRDMFKMAKNGHISCKLREFKSTKFIPWSVLRKTWLDIDHKDACKALDRGTEMEHFVSRL